MKIVSTGKTLFSEDFYEKKRKARRKRFYIFLIGLISILIVLIAVSRLQALRLSKVNVSGAKVIDAESVESAAKDVLSGYYFWLVPKDNAFIYSRQAVKSALERRFPRFSSIKLSLEGSQSLNVDVVEREPFALYCGEPSVCYFLDDQGFIFDLAPSFSDGVYFTYLATPPLESPLGSEFLHSSEFKMLTSFIKDLGALGIYPKRLEKRSDEFRLVLANGARIIWPREGDLALIYSNLESFLKSEPIVAQQNFLDKVSELDLRTENKVFYRFRE